MGYAYFFARRYDEALATYKHSLDIDQNFYFTHYSLGEVLLEKGQYSEAIASMRKAVELSGGDPWAEGDLALALARSGQRDEAIKIIGKLEHLAASNYVPGFVIALPYAALGDRDRALAWLEKEVNNHGSDGLAIAGNPHFEGLRGDPRFRALLKRMNLPE